MGANPSSRSNPAEKAEKQVKAYNLRLRGLSLRAIASQMGISHETVRVLIADEAADRVLPLANELRTQQLDRLNEMRVAAMAVLEREHLHISDGRVVSMGGSPIVDDAPVLQAIDRLIKIEDRTAKLLGLDAPVQQEIAATLNARPVELEAAMAQAKAQMEAEEARIKQGES